ncbi:MAG: hypothetical protein CL666_07595 [Balneola sp.]|nr:hypothetical protein [Balneola sp.]|tara:strand:+ start:76557 stop:78011 length:1455 start_codon:yes stop_codon:yes gene_type:complete
MAPKKKDQIHNIDQKRLSLFVRYLEKHSATIELKKEGGAKFVYTSNQNDGNPSIRSLLSEDPMNLSENEIKEIFLDWPLRKKHSYKDRIVEDLKIIEGITFYLAGDGRVDDGKNSLKLDNPFGIRDAESALAQLNFGNKNKANSSDLDNCVIRGSCYIGNFLNRYPEYMLNTINEYIHEYKYNLSDFYAAKTIDFNYLNWNFKHVKDLGKLPLLLFSFPFYDKFFNSGKSLLSGIIRTERYDSFYENDRLIQFPKILDDFFSTAINLYEDFKVNEKSNAYLIPYYKDFSVTEYMEYSEDFKSFKNTLGNGEKIIKGVDLKEKWAFKNRYEILEFFKDYNFGIESRDPIIHALLIFTYLEHIAFKALVEDSINYLINETRFIISGSKNLGDIDYQEDSIDLEDVSKTLSGYLFKSGLKKTLKINDLNILQDKVYRYSNKSGVKGKLEPEEIKSIIEITLKNYYQRRILEDNFINSKRIENALTNK